MSSNTPASGKTCGKCIRGLLCSSCNMMLGSAKDNIKTLETAIQYLGGYNEKLYAA